MDYFIKWHVKTLCLLYYDTKRLSTHYNSLQTQESNQEKQQNLKWIISSQPYFFMKISSKQSFQVACLLTKEIHVLVAISYYY